MTKEERQTTLLAMKNTMYGTALKEELEEHFKYIGDITKTESWEETLGRKFALKVLRDLFSYLNNKDRVEKPKNLYE